MANSEANASPASKTVGPATLQQSQRWVLGFGSIALGVGAVGGRLIPPPYADGQFWETFVTSPGFGGSLAVLGAGGAAVVALLNSRHDRAQKKRADNRSQWWDRFSWACEKAIATDPADTDLGLTVLRALLDDADAREEDALMALNVLNVLLRRKASSEHAVASASDTPEAPDHSGGEA